MKRSVLIAVLAAIVFAVSAHAEIEMIGGVAGGYAIGGPSTNETFYTATAGTCLKEFNPDTKLFTVARYDGNGTDSHWGVKAILANRIARSKWLWVLIDAGALENAFTNTDGSTTTAFTLGAGIAASASPNVSISLFGEAIKVGPKEWDRVLWLAPTWHVKL